MIPPLAAGAGSDLLALHRLDSRRYPFLLESAAAHAATGRYDILFAFPQQAIEQRGAQLIRRHAGRRELLLGGGDLLQALAAHTPAAATSALPFSGGWFLYFGYETAARVEPGLRLPASPYALPDALAVYCEAAVVVDRLCDTTTLVAASPTQLQTLAADLDASRALAADHGRLPEVQIDEDDPQRFLSGVGRIHEYLRAGDSFQVNLSRRWTADFAEPVGPAALYAALRRSNPAPFAGLMCWDGSAVLSSSPERLLLLDEGRIETRPIAGTAPRAASGDDAQARETLIASLKDRAEHIMLLDLERNDLGRVCMPGSVQVAELIGVESYALVHHLVSSVTGRVRPGIGAAEVLRALFPGGTITGCPKVRAMEIIAELEGVGRGPYTGSMGYLSNCGRMDLNILIRTLVLEGRTASLRAGAGIVADSQPQAELAETRQKARALLRALDPAQ